MGQMHLGPGKILKFRPVQTSVIYRVQYGEKVVVSLHNITAFS
jgi:hypothetical protein